MMRKKRYALAGPAPPSPPLPHRAPHRFPHQLSPQPPHASVSILPPLHGAFAFAELAGVTIITAATSVQRVCTLRRGRCTHVARVSPTSSGAISETAACSDSQRGPISLGLSSRGQETTTLPSNLGGVANLNLALCYFFFLLQRTMMTITEHSFHSRLWHLFFPFHCFLLSFFTIDLQICIIKRRLSYNTSHAYSYIMVLAMTALPTT